nr:MAG TPA: hypothetical protein [Caudoviricetes sp.]
MFDKEILKSKIDLKDPGPAMEYLDSTMSSKEIYDYLENYIKNAENEIVYLPIILKCIIFMHIIELECDMHLNYTIFMIKQLKNIIKKINFLHILGSFMIIIII